MPVLNRIAAFAPEMAGWRRYLHQHPELGQDCVNTAAYVVERLREFGIDEIHEGIARTGVVALIHGQGPRIKGGPVIGLRADMDALPITEASGVPHASLTPGKMHACGHDGHTAMLLGAAKYLAETRNFAGSVALIFQPAEETGGGAEVMVAEGMMERFGIGQVYALHNAPGTAVGGFRTTPGPIMAAVDTFHIEVTGRGGHGAVPHQARDPVVAAVGIVQAIQTISSRNHNALDDLVISVTQIHAGTAHNIIPETASINGTIRTFTAPVLAMVKRRLAEIVAGQAASFGVGGELRFEPGFPPTVNDAGKTRFAAEVAREVGLSVDDDAPREMIAEDFCFMLNARPGAYLLLGNGDTAGLHHPGFDFNDETAPYGASFFAKLVERAQPLGQDL